MSRSTMFGLTLACAAFAAGCSGAGARHLQYDYGRAFSAAVVGQADLTRPSVANLQHPLSGVEAEAIRIRVKESTSDAETGEATLQQGQ